MNRHYLLEQPQSLGVIPTRWFWRDGANWRLVRWPLAILVASMVVVLGFVRLNPFVEGLIAGAVIALAQGLLERFIRKQACKRRALAEASAARLPPGPISPL
jgi:hypothetical protein